MPPGRGGGYLVLKRVPTVVGPLRSGGCHDPRWLKKLKMMAKKGGCPLIILYNRGAS